MCLVNLTMLGGECSGPQINPQEPHGRGPQDTGSSTIVYVFKWAKTKASFTLNVCKLVYKKHVCVWR